MIRQLIFVWLVREMFCPCCSGTLSFKKGIEVGNTFKLGTKYSEALGLYYTDEDNQLKPVVMGCYGIGIARVLAAFIEQHHDDAGIVLLQNFLLMMFVLLLLI